MVRNIIVDRDGVVYLDNDLGDFLESEKAIMPFCRCTLRQKEKSPIFEYRLDKQKIIMQLSSGASIEQIIKVFEARSIEPVPIEAFDEFKFIQELEVVLEQNNNGSFTITSNNNDVLTGISRRKNGPNWRRCGSKISVDARETSKLKNILKGVIVKGVEINNMVSEDELLSIGVPLNYLAQHPDVKITEYGGGSIKLVQAPNLEEIVAQTRSKVREEFEKIKSEIPDNLARMMKEVFDNDLENPRILNKFRVQQALSTFSILASEIDPAFQERVDDYIKYWQKETSLGYSKIFEILKSRGWNFVYETKELLGNIMMINAKLYPERAVYRNEGSNKKICAFLVEGPYHASISDIRREIGGAVVKHGDVLGEKSREIAEAYFCKFWTIKEIEVNLRIKSYSSIIDSIIATVKEFTKRGLLSEDARIKGLLCESRAEELLEVKVVEEPEKSEVFVVVDLPVETPLIELYDDVVFFKENNVVYQRVDLFEREWRIILSDLKDSNLKTVSRNTKFGSRNYVALSESIQHNAWVLSDETESFVRSVASYLPRRAYQLLRDHFFYSNSIRLLSKEDDKRYLCLLDEMEEALEVCEIFSRNLSPQFTRRRLFEADMDFVPLYKSYFEFGMPSCLIAGKFNELIVSLDYERGVIASKSCRNFIENIRQSVVDRLKKFSSLLPNNQSQIMDVLFSHSRSLSELEACAGLTEYQSEINRAVLTSYELLMQAPEAQGANYVPLLEVSKTYNVPAGMLRSLEGIRVVKADKSSYVLMDDALRVRLEKLQSNENKNIKATGSN